MRGDRKHCFSANTCFFFKINSHLVSEMSLEQLLSRRWERWWTVVSLLFVLKGHFSTSENMYSPTNLDLSALMLKGLEIPFIVSCLTKCCSDFSQGITSLASFEPLTPPQNKMQASWLMSSCYLKGGMKECSLLSTGLTETWPLGEYISEAGGNSF